MLKNFLLIKAIYIIIIKRILLEFESRDSWRLGGHVTWSRNTP